MAAPSESPMLVFLIRRSLQSIAVLFAMSLIVFAGVYVIGDPVLVMISPEATQADIAATRAAFGLDQSLWIQYGRFVSGALSGDLGRSYAYSAPAIKLILERMPATMELAVVAMAIAIALGIPLGLWAGLKPDSIAGTLYAYERPRSPLSAPPMKRPYWIHSG